MVVVVGGDRGLTSETGCVVGAVAKGRMRSETSVGGGCS